MELFYGYDPKGFLLQEEIYILKYPSSTFYNRLRNICGFI